LDIVGQLSEFVGLYSTGGPISNFALPKSRQQRNCLLEHVFCATLVHPNLLDTVGQLLEMVGLYNYRGANFQSKNKSL